MVHAIRPWLVFVALVALALPPAMLFSWADSGTMDEGRRTRDEGRGTEGPAFSRPSPLAPRLSSEDRPPPFVLPPPPDYTAAVHEDWGGSPLLDRPEAGPPGFFLNVESSVVWPHFTNELVGGAVTLAQTSGVAPGSSVGLPPGAGMPITGDLVSFRGNRFNPTVTPRFELGYRFSDGFGELRLGYRFMDSRGADTVLVAPPESNDNLGFASQTGRLDVNIIDLDYGTREFSLGPDWEMRLAVGLRYATAFLDSQVTFLKPVTLTGSPFGTGSFTRLSQSEALGNRYFGAHGVFEVGRKLWVPGLTLFGRLEGAGMYGRVHQTFKERFVEAPGFTQQRVTNGVGTPMLAGQVGLSYDVPAWNHCRFMIGYQFEEWWQFGRGDNDLSFGPLSDQGLFLRTELTF